MAKSNKTIYDDSAAKGRALTKTKPLSERTKPRPVASPSWPLPKKKRY